ncbi:unnamed protein product [Ilex paraguariensis]|uniref:Drought induced 19 protein type zinc-binding domain-containing protein n=1 Tax=Ilex paraguariensis TaxID=185542 RepID=A0ABC8SHU9_9AQUA
MDADSWSARLSSASKRYQSALQSRSNMLMAFEELDADDDIREEFPCPFCSEYFDIVGLCCHIDDEHPIEAKNGECPVCAVRVGVDMVAHITLHHGNIFKISFLRGRGNPEKVGPIQHYRSDPLLSSFILPMSDDFVSAQSQSSADAISVKKSMNESISERYCRKKQLHRPTLTTINAHNDAACCTL